MKKFVEKLWISGVFIIFLFVYSCNSDNEEVVPQEAEVQIPDNALAQAVRQRLNLPQEVAFTTENLKGVDSLNLRGTGVNNLTGIEGMTNLVFLDLRELPISDISPLKNLRNLKWLSLRETQVNNITALQGHTELEYLNLNRLENITNISPIANSVKLKELIVRDVQIGNPGLLVIENFTELFRLNMRNSGVTDLAPIGRLMASGALQDKGPEGATIDIRDNPIPNEPGNDGYAPVRPYWFTISDRSPEILPDPLN
ncbi:hypothetical protein BH23BAC1_BH23BAC1_39930 [soil metagenome]